MTAIPLVEVSAVVVALAGDDSSHRSRSWARTGYRQHRVWGSADPLSP